MYLVYLCSPRPLGAQELKEKIASALEGDVSTSALSQVQGDQLNMAVFFWYLEKSNLSSLGYLNVGENLCFKQE